jgi:hypothetical protein
MKLIYTDGDLPDAPAGAEVVNTRPGTPMCHAVTLTADGDITDDASVQALFVLLRLHGEGRIEIGHGA